MFENKNFEPHLNSPTDRKYSVLSDSAESWKSANSELLSENHFNHHPNNNIIHNQNEFKNIPITDDDLLHSASDNIYEVKKPKRSCIGTIFYWYKPIYDYSDPDSPPKFCGGKLKKWQFILLNILWIFLLLSLIMLPLIYFLIVPAYIQYRIDTIDAGLIRMDFIKVRDFDAQGMSFDINASMPPLSFFPIKAGFGPCIFTVYDKNNQPLTDINIPFIEFMLNDDMLLNFSGQINMEQSNLSAIAAHISSFSSPDGLQDFHMDARTTLPLFAMGIKLYSALPLHKSIQASAKSDLNSLANSIPSFIVASDTNKEIRSHYNQSDILNILPELGYPEISLPKMNISVTDSGMTIDLEAAFDNPLKVIMENLSNVEIGLKIDQTTVLRTKINQMNLNLGYQVMQLSIDIILDDPSISPADVKTAISDAVRKMLSGDLDSLNIFVAGPIFIENTPYMQVITAPLAIKLPILDLVESFNTQNVRDLFSMEGVMSVIGKSTLEVNVLSDRIFSPAEIVLPNLIAIPRQILFNYNTSMSIGNENVQAMDIVTGAVLITRDDINIKISTSATIIPVNTIIAAEAIASAINPLLAAEPKESSISIFDFSFLKMNGHGFKWCESLFKGLPITISIPNIICKECVLSWLTSNGTSIPISIPYMDIHQLDFQPGFNTNGVIAIPKSSVLPDIHVSIGYLETDIILDELTIASTVLKNGLKYDAEVLGTSLDANMILKKNIAEKIQTVISSFWNSESSSSFVGATGFNFGTSEESKIITFSLIKIAISLQMIEHGVSKLTTGSSINSLISPGMLKINDVDLNIISSSNILFGLQTTFQNPSNISISMGTIEFGLNLDKAELFAIRILSLHIARGTGGFNIQTEVEISRGSNILSEKIAEIVNQIMAGSLSNNYALDLVDLELTPINSPFGPGKIDMLKSLIIPLQMNLFNSIISNANIIMGANSPVDFNAVLPTLNDLNKVNPEINSVELIAKAHSTLLAGIALGYNNPLPISVKIPFMAFTITLGDSSSEFVSFDISGISIIKGKGFMNIHTSIHFSEIDNSLPSKVSSFFTNIINGKIDPSIGIRNIQFGSSNSDRNVLLSKILVDLTTIAKTYVDLLGPHIVAISQEILSAVTSNDSTLKIDGTSDGGISVQITPGIGVTVHEVDIAFLPQKAIEIFVDTSMALPFSAHISLPFFSVSVGLDEHPFMKSQFYGIEINSDIVTKAKLKMHLTFEDTKPLAEVFAEILDGDSSKILDVIQLHGLELGVSQNDYISSFSQIRVPIPLGGILKLASDRISKEDLSHIDVSKILKSFGLQIDSVVTKSLPNKTMKCGTAIRFKNSFKLSLKGLGFAKADVGIDEVPLVSMKSSGANLVPGLNDLQIGGDFYFPSSDNIKDKLSHLSLSIINDGVGHSSENFTASGLSFGFSDNDNFDFLEKLRFSIPSSWILNQNVIDAILPIVKNIVNVDINDLNLGKRVSVKKFNFDASSPGFMLLETDVGIHDFKMQVDVEMGFFSGNAHLDSEVISSFSIPSGMRMATSNSILDANMGVHVSLGESDILQSSIATIVDNIYHEKEIGNTVGIADLKFGFSSDDYIDSFSTIAVKINMNPFIAPAKDFAKKIANEYINGNINLKMDISKIEMDVIEHNTFGNEVVLHVPDLPETVSINLPFGDVTVILDGNNMVSPSMKLSIAKGVVHVNMEMPFEDSRENGQKLIQIIRNVIWHQTNILSYNFDMSGMRFGASKESSFKLATKVKVPVPFGPALVIIKKNIDTSRPLEIVNMPTIVNNRGIEATVYAKILPESLPVRFKCHEVNSSVLYQVGGTGRMIHTADGLFKNLDISPGKPISMDVLLVPDIKTNGIQDSFSEAVLFLLNGTDYAQNARLGNITFKGSNGAIFDLMKESYMQAPDLYLWKPITMTVKPSNPIRKEGLEIIPVEFQLSFPNPGPLHLDMGLVRVSISNAGRDLMRIETPGPIVVKNVLEGGNDLSILNPDNGVFRTILPWSDFNPLLFFKHLLDLLHPKKYSLDVNVVRPSEGNIEWIAILAKHIMKKDEIKALIPVMISLIGRMHWKIFGMKVSNGHDVPGLKQFLDESDLLISRYNTSNFHIVYQE